MKAPWTPREEVERRQDCTCCGGRWTGSTALAGVKHDPPGKESNTWAEGG
jgi:hypothetical protein